MLTKKLQNIVDEALSAGLTVEISNSPSALMEFVTIRIGSGYAKDFYKPSTLMQQIVQWDSVAIYASRRAESGKAFKIKASRFGVGGTVDEMDPKILKYKIEDMGQQVDKYLRGKIEIDTAA